MFDPINNRHCNHSLGAPAGWDQRKDGKCGSLPVYFDGRDYMSWWRPTAADIQNMQAGKPIRLVVCGVAHPPVSIDVDCDNEGVEIDVVPALKAVG